MSVVIQPRPFDPKKFSLVLIVLLAFFIYTYTRKPPPQLHQWSGQTMGTWYSVKVADDFGTLPPGDHAAIQMEIDELLAELNRQMSTYIPDSEISRFNRHDSITPFEISPAFRDVVQASLDLARLTDHAFNPLLDPLIELWGFGATGPQKQPTTDRVIVTLESTRPDGLALNGTELIKQRPDIQINLNAIAKGYAVDQIAALLEARNLTNVFVEIGGDGVAHGLNHHGRPWRVGIETPTDRLHEVGDRVLRILHLNGQAFATSGDYRNFAFGEDGRPYSHILDPRTGTPAMTDIASVTVLGPTCMGADGLATALFVMGVEEGLAWVESQPDYHALFIVRADDESSFELITSRGFDRFLASD